MKPSIVCCAASVALSLLACVSQAAMVGGNHDFMNPAIYTATSGRYVGPGVCGECHVAHNFATPGATRLYPRNVGSTAKFLCGDCHGTDGTQKTMPADANFGFPAGWSGPRPPPIPPSHVSGGAGFDLCTKCHKHYLP